MTQQSFSESRQNLKVSAFIELFVMTVKLAYEGFYETWHGYRVMAIDGSKPVQTPCDYLEWCVGVMRLANWIGRLHFNSYWIF